MVFSNAHKSLLITLYISASVILMAYSFHIKQRETHIAETFYELLPEDTENLPNPESLEEILKSFDEISTNKAFNEQKDHENFEDNDFKETMEKLNNRHQATSFTSPPQNPSELGMTVNDETTSSYESINAIIENTAPLEGGNKNSSISFSLVGREKIHIPPPIYLCEASGKIVISITVDPTGRVIEAQYNNASNSNNGCLVDHAIEYAKASKFNASPQRTSNQIGTITFLFRGKS